MKEIFGIVAPLFLLSLSCLVFLASVMQLSQGHPDLAQQASTNAFYLLLLANTLRYLFKEEPPCK